MSPQLRSHLGSELSILTTSIGVISSGRGENLRYIMLAERSGYLPARVKIVLTDQPDAGASRSPASSGFRASISIPEINPVKSTTGSS